MTLLVCDGKRFYADLNMSVNGMLSRSVKFEKLDRYIRSYAGSMAYCTLYDRLVSRYLDVMLTEGVVQLEFHEVFKPASERYYVLLGDGTCRLVEMEYCVRSKKGKLSMFALPSTVSGCGDILFCELLYDSGVNIARAIGSVGKVTPEVSIDSISVGLTFNHNDISMPLINDRGVVSKVVAPFRLHSGK